MLRKLLRFLYRLMPKFLREYGNIAKTFVRLKYFGLSRGRTGPQRPEDVLGERHGKLIEGYLSARIIRKDGTVEKIDLGADKFDEGPNTVTDAGVAFLVDDWDNNATDITNFNYHAMGTGGSPPSTPATSVTALVTEVESRVVGTKSQPSANQIRSVATITATAPRTVNEWGLFSAASGPTIWSSRWFTAIVLASGDAIEFTYTLTISSFTA